MKVIATRLPGPRIPTLDETIRALLPGNLTTKEAVAAFTLYCLHPLIVFNRQPFELRFSFSKEKLPSIPMSVQPFVEPNSWSNAHISISSDGDTQNLQREPLPPGFSFVRPTNDDDLKSLSHFSFPNYTGPTPLYLPALPLEPRAADQDMRRAGMHVVRRGLRAVPRPSSKKLLSEESQKRPRSSHSSECPLPNAKRVSSMASGTKRIESDNYRGM